MTLFSLFEEAFYPFIIESTENETVDPVRVKFHLFRISGPLTNLCIYIERDVCYTIMRWAFSLPLYPVHLSFKI